MTTPRGPTWPLVTRLGHPWPPVPPRGLNEAAKTKAIFEWGAENKRRKAIRAKRLINYVADDEVDEYTELLSDLRDQYYAPTAMGMPTYG